MAVFHPRTRLGAYVEGLLDTTSRQRVEQHLQDCPLCTQEVAQRRRIHELVCSRLPERRPAPQPHGSTVLERRDGVRGHRLGLSLGVAAVAAGSLVTAAWIAGAPQAPSTALPATQQEPAPAAALLTEDAAPTASGIAQTAAVAEDAAVWEESWAAGQDVDFITDQATFRTVTEDGLEELRAVGWTAPSLEALGLRPQSARLQVGQDAVQLDLRLQGHDAVVLVRECRLTVDEACPAVLQAASETRTMPLPMGGTGELVEQEDGTWTAVASTEEAAYLVESTLPETSARQIMGLVVLSERGRVTSPATSDTVTDRLTRGFERLVPWVAGMDESS